MSANSRRDKYEPACSWRMQQVFPANSQVKDDAGEAANPTRGLHNVGPLRSLRHNKCDCDPVAIYQSLEKKQKTCYWCAHGSSLYNVNDNDIKLMIELVLQYNMHLDNEGIKKYIKQFKDTLAKTCECMEPTPFKLLD